LQYDFTESFGMRVEAERYRIDDAIGNKGDIDMYSLGLIYRFGEKKQLPSRKQRRPHLLSRQHRWLILVPVIVQTEQYCSILDSSSRSKVTRFRVMTRRSSLWWEPS